MYLLWIVVFEGLYLPNGIIVAPITYRLDGQQYVAVMMGWGGAFALAGGQGAYVPRRDFTGRLLVFKLGGDARLPPAHPQNLGIFLCGLCIDAQPRFLERSRPHWGRVRDIDDADQRQCSICALLV